MRTKIKMKLISEYIYLKKVDNFYKNSHTDCDFFKEKTEKLIKIYKKIFFKYGIFDLSFAVLQKELSEKDCSNFVLNDLEIRLDEIETSIFLFIKKCGLNEFEKRYVIE